MSQERLDGALPPKPHLQTRPLIRDNGRKSSNQDAEKDLEWYCGACGARVTLSPTSSAEYGHALDCDHRVVRSGDGDAR